MATYCIPGPGAFTTAQLRAALLDSDSADLSGFVPCDAGELLRQIGTGNLMAISGRRAVLRTSGVTLPVSAGYSVTVDLAANDTYTVRRRLTRGGTSYIKGEVAGVYCDQVGEIAYRASCFRNVPFPA